MWRDDYNSKIIQKQNTLLGEVDSERVDGHDFLDKIVIIILLVAVAYLIGKDALPNIFKKE